MKRGEKIATAILSLGFAALLGLGLGAFTAPNSLRAAQTCEKRACDTSQNRCVDTDIQYSCKGNPCVSTAC